MHRLPTLSFLALVSNICFADCASYLPPKIDNGTLVANAKQSSYENIVISKPVELIKSIIVLGGATSIHEMKHQVIENLAEQTPEFIELQSPCDIPLVEETEYILFLSNRDQKHYIHSLIKLNSNEAQEMYSYLKTRDKFED